MTKLPKTNLTRANKSTPSSESSGFKISSPSIGIPKGGGSIRGIDEKISINPVTGSASVSIPLPFSSAGGSTPSFSLHYDSGNGNGVFGMGWSLDVKTIRRKTSEGIPQYGENDIFILSGYEDLVPVRQGNDEEILFEPKGNSLPDIHEDTNGLYQIQLYRPRIEGLFARIERWTEKLSGDFHWRVISNENYTTIYGKGESAKIIDPETPGRIFEWLPEFSYDDKGRCVAFDYRKEDMVGLDPTKTHNAGRITGTSRFTNSYLKRICHGNFIPYEIGKPIPEKWMFETVFDYGERDMNSPWSNIENEWKVREDAFSNYLPGFEIRVIRLCRGVLFYHNFDELPGGACLTKSLSFRYSNASGLNMLEKVIVTGYTKHDDSSYSSEDIPPLEFTYQNHDWNNELNELDQSLDLFSDLYNEGLPGLLKEEIGAWYYKRNWGYGNFGPAELLSKQPSPGKGKNLNTQLADLEANGEKQVVSLSKNMSGFFKLDPLKGFEAFRSFAKIPIVDEKFSQKAMIDLTGDGRPDILLLNDRIITWYPSEGKTGYAPPRSTSIRFGTSPWKDAPGNGQSLSSTFFSDMTGDGLTDLIRIRDGEVRYWPNKGYGHFGEGILMDNSPRLGDEFDPSRIILHDLDGSGTADLLYIGNDAILTWLNRSGNEFVKGIDIPHSGISSNQDDVVIADLLGTGMPCIIFNKKRSINNKEPLKYSNPLAGKQPYLLTNFKNNRGIDVVISYKPSTYYYLEDKKNDNPWVTNLHFPVQCVSKIKTTDQVRNSSTITEYKYHHGYYDHFSKEFRGFGRVDQIDNEVDRAGLLGDQAPVLTKLWFHTGAIVDGVDIVFAFKKEYFNRDIFSMVADLGTKLPRSIEIDQRYDAMRAVKGSLLRKEVYGLDGAPNEQIPYSIEQFQYNVELLVAGTQYSKGVFLLQNIVQTSFLYERKVDDPRVAQIANLEFDSFGNVLLQVNVAYPRRNIAGDVIHDPQKQLLIHYTQCRFTNHISIENCHRTPMPYQRKGFSLNGLKYEDQYYSIEELKAFFVNSLEVDCFTMSSLQMHKNVLEILEHEYLDDDGCTPLPVGNIAAKGLIYRSIKATFNENFLMSNFGDLESVNNLVAILTDFSRGGYLQKDGYFWISSGSQQFDKDRFFIPVEVTDALGNITKIEYDKYSLFPERVIDPLNNSVTVRRFNYRTLSPYLVEDMNGNLSAVRFDDIGRITRKFILGKLKIDNGDEFDHSKVEIKDAVDFPSSVILYTFNEWFRTGSVPDFYITSVRETHYHAGPASVAKWLDIYSWLDGSGNTIQEKAMAEPGEALRANADGSYTKIPDTSPAIRWLSSGTLVVNNKNNIVRTYEPYFSTAAEFDFHHLIARSGAETKFLYDALGRVIRTDYANGTFSRVDLGAWQQMLYDRNDTVAESSWYHQRIVNPDPATATPAEVEAAKKTMAHNDTPSIDHLDTLGRPFAHIDTMGGNVQQVSLVEYDIQGNELSCDNARGVKIIRSTFDMIGMKYEETSFDSGRKRWLYDAVGRKLVSWDNLGNRISYQYDALGRKETSSFRNLGGSDVIFEKTQYGESLSYDVAFQKNLLGKVYKHFDQSGIITCQEYDFKYNLLKTVRQFVKDYTTIVDWRDTAAVILDPEQFDSNTDYDALNRPIKTVLPYRMGEQPNEYQVSYNEGGLLNALTLAVGANAPITNISKIVYNAKRQKKSVFLANGTKTTYTYDNLSLRLKSLVTTRDNGTECLQDLRYTYDPQGNLIESSDFSQPDLHYNGELVRARTVYTYDPIYEVISVSGRKHAGQTNLNYGQSQGGYRNYPFIPSSTIDPNDSSALCNYVENYKYDGAGNMLEIQHISKSNRWTRSFNYGKDANRLMSCITGSGAINYTFDNNGNMYGHGHLGHTKYDFLDQLREVDLRGGGKAWYSYDASGQRTRKVVERQDGSKNIRLYLGGVEVYKEINQLEETVTERHSLLISEGERIVLIVDIPLIFRNATQSKPLFRYQYGDHLGSVALELDETGKIISREEYGPFGTTTFYITDASRETNAKRYRYTGKERDEESGFSYHGARYYLPWLCRWANTDPDGINDGLNAYTYVHNNPLKSIDDTGKKTKPATSLKNSQNVFNNALDALAKRFGKDKRLELSGDYDVINKRGLIHVEPGDGTRYAIRFMNNKFDVIQSPVPIKVDGMVYFPTVHFSWDGSGNLTQSAEKGGTDIHSNSAAKPKQSQYERMMADSQTREAIENASRVTGILVSDLSVMAIIESGGRANVGANRLGYTGLMQMGRTAVADLLARSPQASKLGITWERVQNDVKYNALAGALYWRLNQRELEANNVPINLANMYLAHQQGVRGMRSLLRDSVAAPNAPLTERQQTNIPRGSGIATRRQFFDYWNNRMNEIQRTIPQR
ncbi:SpvB/TcaC N-terminal domain-containing protein [Pedobacter gandavensis]|uniref:SpvB/TcaC N-terminal domain-containing protein n=1 Tax=Pedobacter gandavensis TaxID=2679963 RepID=UPI00292E8030|nr:SpvB/TcaC N-terminal domain-containing protein [Pedobacter gandavensis]